jgi:hypothetical protein
MPKKRKPSYEYKSYLRTSLSRSPRCDPGPFPTTRLAACLHSKLSRTLSPFLGVLQSGHSSGTFSRHQHQLYAEASPPTSPNGSGGTGVGGGTWQLFAPSTPRTIAAGSVTLTRTGSGDSVGVGDVDVGGSAGAPGTRLTESRSRSRLRSREGAYSPNTVMRAGGAYVVPKVGRCSVPQPNTRCPPPE